ncbi:MAG: condensation domain-containing protein, partial [Verrucomicrobiaceae bacterium]
FANAMPFAELALQLGGQRNQGMHSIFDVRFALQNHPVPDVVLPRISTKLRMRSTGTARFDLGCEITESGAELEVVWLYRHDMFSKANLAELDTLFQTVVTNVCRSPESRIGAVTD